MKNVHKGNFSEAISNFEKSYEFFKKYHWLDKFRYLFLLSSSKISYKEMALCNIAFCYGQIGNGEKLEHYYNLTLKEFPDSFLAKSALNVINSIKIIDK
jgi:tetratricopeptide (TPR) repeat protein